jgi:hypothetical protein
MCRLLTAKKIGAISVKKRKPRKGGEGEGGDRVGLISVIFGVATRSRYAKIER